MGSGICLRVRHLWRSAVRHFEFPPRPEPPARIRGTMIYPESSHAQTNMGAERPCGKAELNSE